MVRRSSSSELYNISCSCNYNPDDQTVFSLLNIRGDNIYTLLWSLNQIKNKHLCIDSICSSNKACSRATGDFWASPISWEKPKAERKQLPFCCSLKNWLPLWQAGLCTVLLSKRNKYFLSEAGVTPNNRGPRKGLQWNPRADSTLKVCKGAPCSRQVSGTWGCHSYDQMDHPKARP